VPFQLGHPLGTPNDAEFQKRVLIALLGLFNRTDCPVIEDYDEEEEENDEVVMLSCPVNYSNMKSDSGDDDSLLAALKREMMAMRSWYEASVAKRGRTTVGVSGIALDNLGSFVCSFLQDGLPENPRDDVPLSNTLKMAVEDLKSYYIEGLTAQPGQETASSRKLADWFWDETVAGKVVWEIREACGRVKTV
jgi:hypothetical protein